MPSGSPVALILGAGANVGQHVAHAFVRKGYKIALAARSLEEEDSTPDQLHIQADFADPDSISEVFKKVESQLGNPHVVVYNACGWTPNDPRNPLGLSLKDFSSDLAINTTSAFAAAQQAARSFAKLPETASRTFIYTGNGLNELPIPNLLNLGLGKTATAYFIRFAANAYKDKGFKFYFADERTPRGGPVGGADGPAHAKLYVELAEGPSQGPWQYTFVKGVGYKKF